MSVKQKNEIKGLVLNIQRFCLHDGPGIRATVFFKGCPLSCSWCANPESIKPFSEIIINQSLCFDCQECVRVCAAKALTVRKGAVMPEVVLDRRKCRLCFSCVNVCPSGALRMVGEEMTVGKVMQTLEAEAPFFRNSGGGVTLSGGEPLLQADFALELLRACKARSFHTVIDTSGFANRKTISAILPYVDLFLYDIKHLNDGAHREGTGVSNQQILNNLKEISKSKPVWLRMPLIPGYNDDDASVSDVAMLFREYHLDHLFLMAYHRMGVGKYQGLGRNYRLAHLESVTEEKVKHIGALLESMGVKDFEIVRH